MKSAPVMAATCSRPTFLYMLRPCVAWAPGPPFNFLASVVFFWPPFQSQRVEKPASTPTVLPHVEHICLEGCLIHIFSPSFFLFLPWHFFFARSFTSAFAPKKKKKKWKTKGRNEGNRFKNACKQAASGKPQGSDCASFRTARTIFFQLCKFLAQSGEYFFQATAAASSNFAAHSAESLRWQIKSQQSEGRLIFAAGANGAY